MKLNFVQDEFLEQNLKIFLEKYHEDDFEFEESFLLKLLSSLDVLLESKLFSENDILDFFIIAQMVVNAHEKLVRKCFEKAKIRLTPKDQKKGRVGFLQRLSRRYSNEFVRNTLKELLEWMFNKQILKLKEEASEQNIAEIFDELDFENVYWICSSVLKNESAVLHLREKYTIDLIFLKTRLLSFLKQFHFEEMMKGEAKEGINSSSTLSQLQKENQKLKKQLGKQSKETSKLKANLHQMNAEKKKLKGEVFELEKTLEENYADALEEIERLNFEMKVQNELFEQERTFYLEAISALQREWDDFKVESPSLASTPSLLGKTICVIGGARERHYREAIEKHGGEIKYVSWDDPLQIKGSVMQSDAVMFLTELSSHPFFWQSHSLSKERGIPFVFINSKGLTSFERELVHLAKKISG